ncbi:MAG: hypothetical protein U5L03_16520 [Burkholderiaceae bacterium]|nr:hypothetical protein [Burkholderiaceae bacterium]
MRKAWMPPEVAQAPMAISRRLCCADMLDALEVFRRRYAAFDEGDIHVGIRIERPGLGKVHQIDPLGEREQVLAEIEQGQLAAIAGAELVHRHTRLHRIVHRCVHQKPLCAPARP